MMKPFPRRIRVFVLLALAVFSATVHAAPEADDPIVGDWWWIYNMYSVTFKADGTFTATNHTRGTWECVDPAAASRKYLLVWKHGKYLDKVVCSEDGRQAEVVNQLEGQFTVHRATPDTPTVPPEPGDPVIGDWVWFRDQPVTFNADGTATSANGMHGTWEKLRGGVDPARKYRLNWDHGRYVDVFKVSTDARTARVQSSADGEYEVHRASPAEQAPRP